jgi:filamentous hemagglutinin family protein
MFRFIDLPKVLRHISLAKFNQLVVLIISISFATTGLANPVLNGVTSGGATVTQSGNTTTVNQTTDKAIIEWNSFNIAAGEKTQFVQPGASSVALNRVNPTQGASQIMGSLTSNGQIIIVNAAGIHFGSGSMVNVGGMIASTADITNANFLAGKFIFNIASTYGGSIINEGNISAANYGLVALLGTSVINHGLIQAELGNIVLASGNKFTLDFMGDQLINFSIDEAANGAGVDANGNKVAMGVSNDGALLADGGKILVSAQQAEGVLDNVINMGGIAQAQSVAEQNGEIILDGGSNGNVNVSGKVDASGKAMGNTGGTVKVLGNQVALMAG